MVYGDADYNSNVSPLSLLPPRFHMLSRNQANSKPGNWLGGEAIYNSIGVPGSPTPGYVNISTSDLVVHGQAKQSGAFSFARIYESGHEVPYYQPLTALAIFERAINGYDIATGQDEVNRDYVTVGPAKSTYREGNATVMFALVQSGEETVVNATTYDHVMKGESAPSRQLLAELEALGGSGGDKVAVGNATAFGGVLEGLKEVGKDKEPIHLRKRDVKVRGGGSMLDEVTGVEGNVFVRRGLDDLGI